MLWRAHCRRHPTPKSICVRLAQPVPIPTVPKPNVPLARRALIQTVEPVNVRPVLPVNTAPQVLPNAKIVQLEPIQREGQVVVPVAPNQHIQIGHELVVMHQEQKRHIVQQQEVLLQRQMLQHQQKQKILEIVLIVRYVEISTRSIVHQVLAENPLISIQSM